MQAQRSLASRLSGYKPDKKTSRLQQPADEDLKDRSVSCDEADSQRPPRSTTTTTTAHSIVQPLADIETDAKGHSSPTSDLLQSEHVRCLAVAS